MRSLRTLTLAVSAAALLAVPATAPASTAEVAPPEIVQDVVDCAKGTVGAYVRWLQGYPMPYNCQIG